MVDNHVISEENYHDEIGLRGFDLICLTKTKRELVKKY